MLKFRTFLAEEKSAAIPHLQHLGGEEHFYGKEKSDADISRLEDLHKFLKNEKSSVASVGVKADGSPSFEMGHVINPKTGEKEFGVAYKGAARGYAFTQDDINDKFGHSEGLKSKMSQLLEHGKKIMSPLHGLVQGDFMGSKSDGTIKDAGDKLTHKENTITYGYDKNSDEGKSLKRARISIALHTRLDSEGGGREYNLDRDSFYSHPDVHLWDGRFHRKNVKYDADAEELFQKHLNDGKTKLSQLRDHDGLVEGHTDHLQTYINKTVRENTNPTAGGYRKHLKEKLQKDVDKVKTDAAKQRKTDYMEGMLSHIDENKDEFGKLFSAHQSLDKAKGVLLNSLENSGQNQEHTINGEKTKPEGFVIGYKDGQVRKVVNRSEFSRLNFLKP
jgi:hypothetical protein